MAEPEIWKALIEVLFDIMNGQMQFDCTGLFGELMIFFFSL